MIQECTIDPKIPDIDESMFNLDADWEEFHVEWDDLNMCLFCLLSQMWYQFLMMLTMWETLFNVGDILVLQYSSTCLNYGIWLKPKYPWIKCLWTWAFFMVVVLVLLGKPDVLPVFDDDDHVKNIVTCWWHIGIIIFISMPQLWHLVKTKIQLNQMFMDLSLW